MEFWKNRGIPPMRERTYKLNTQVIERRREALGMSIDRLARIAGVHVKTLRKWLAGKPAFIENVRKLADALDVQVDIIRQSDGAAATIDANQPSDENAPSKTLNLDGALSLTSEIDDIPQLNHDIMILMLEKRDINVSILLMAYTSDSNLSTLQLHDDYHALLALEGVNTEGSHVYCYVDANISSMKRTREILRLNRPFTATDLGIVLGIGFGSPPWANDGRIRREFAQRVGIEHVYGHIPEPGLFD